MALSAMSHLFHSFMCRVEKMTPADTLELAQQAEQYYEQHLKALLEQSHLNQFVAIEPLSGAYYLGTTLSEAIAAARRADPAHRPYVIRIGHATAVHIGGGTP
jgi:hypothetical protein